MREIGQFHPLLVHLPIGILLVAVAFEWLSRSERHSALGASIPLLFRLGAATAILSCITGWLLGESGDYASATLDWHRWLGIATAGMATVLCFLKNRLIVSTLLAALLLATGHLGGTLTHGEGYLKMPGSEKELDAAIAGNMQEAKIYADLIAPIFKEKCQSCHGSDKQKGGLRLDSPEFIVKGGKNGAVLISSEIVQSELLRRCLLPLTDEDHMPPKAKPQLTDAELKILTWWIAQGADFQKRVKDVPQSEEVKAALSFFQETRKETSPVEPDVPGLSTSPAAPAIVEKLRIAGVLVLPVAQESNWLSVSLINLPQPPDSVFVLLEKISPQVIWLKLSGGSVPDGAWPIIGKMSSLTRLHLDHSSATDAAMEQVKNLRKLQYLNLTNTKVSARGLLALAGLPTLKNVYLYQTDIRRDEWANLQGLFPGYGLTRAVIRCQRCQQTLRG